MVANSCTLYNLNTRTPSPPFMFQAVADSHCHIDVTCTREDAERTADAIAQDTKFRDGFFSVMTTYNGDRELLEVLFHRLGSAQNKLLPYWGVHPWYSHLFTFSKLQDKDRENWKASHYNLVLHPKPSPELLKALPEPIEMEQYLQQLRKSIIECTPPHGKFGIGEIGLDKLFRVPSTGYFGSQATISSGSPRLSQSKVTIEHQKDILQCQLLLSEELSAPVSIHCVKAHGILYSAMENYQGPTVILHSYTGSLDQAKMWVRKCKKLDQQLFFSFSQWINGQKDEQLQQLMSDLDDEHILLESDVSIDRYDLDKYKRDHIEKIATTIKAARNWNDYRILDHNIELATGVPGLS